MFNFAGGGFHCSSALCLSLLLMKLLKKQVRHIYGDHPVYGRFAPESKLAFGRLAFVRAFRSRKETLKVLDMLLHYW